jgi:N-acetylglucosamine kinase-like BadF-type ATPase
LLFMGMDGGNSKTICVIADENGHVVGTGRSGNGNHQNGVAEMTDNVNRALDEALKVAGVRKADIAASCFGLAGADRPSDYDILNPIVEAMGLSRSSITCDTYIGLRAGADRPHGVVLVCGAGTNAMGRNLRGEEFQFGGFGYRYGDFGGGLILSEEVFRAVIRADEGRAESTLLTPRVLERMGYADVTEMKKDFLDRSLEVPVNLVMALFDAARKGDAAAIDLLRRQGEELASSAKAVIGKLGMSGETFPVVLVGSILTRAQGETWTMRPLREALIKLAPGAEIVRLDVEPVTGAILAAMDVVNYELSPEQSKRLRSQLAIQEEKGEQQWPIL